MQESQIPRAFRVVFPVPRIPLPEVVPLDNREQPPFCPETGRSVSSPGIPVVGIIGERVVLPCRVTQDPIPEVFSVRWEFHDGSRRIPVGSFDGKSREQEWDGRFRGRVEFFPREFWAGNVSLGLRNVGISDQGSYTCHVSAQDVSREVSVQLEVAAIGDIPTIVVRSRKRDLSLSCRASGWFPSPEILWLDGRGKVREGFSSPRTTPEPSGLFRVDASVTLPPGSDLEVSCRIVNPRLNVSRESRIRISGGSGITPGIGSVPGIRAGRNPLIPLVQYLLLKSTVEYLTLNLTLIFNNLIYI
ncbi:PREDICTED: butyrophilin subfamily 1 member A1-like [Lepidothrix coronata]|uniref:Butyrophilin subfamily 1 member A1-like n=1 Tax=Lepidothrix coronata TaxID=321398 RepID=A0A6J0J804_9PASS|nr:PREDICTED: butyrophilin subfamily 1 member A1-like [Lepidothrix coronata]